MSINPEIIVLLTKLFKFLVKIDNIKIHPHVQNIRPAMLIDDEMIEAFQVLA